MTSSNTDPFYNLDVELELTLRRLRKARKIVVNNSSSSSSINLEGVGHTRCGVSTLVHQYPQLELAQTYELKSGLIHLQPKFHGLAREDPYKHFKEFQVGIPEDYIKMKAFPFSLDGVAKDWLYLQPALFNTWADMKRIFLEKFFPASKTASIRKEICWIRQNTRETLHEYWEIFNKLYATCPHHQINEQLLI
ncbi:hypothetical protein CR513_39002, partial [Mucuna pruriens]